MANLCSRTSSLETTTGPGQSILYAGHIDGCGREMVDSVNSITGESISGSRLRSRQSDQGISVSKRLASFITSTSTPTSGSLMRSVGVSLSMHRKVLSVVGGQTRLRSVFHTSSDGTWSLRTPLRGLPSQLGSSFSPLVRGCVTHTLPGVWCYPT